ncbi:TonB-dependent receptor domain-containing protein [Myroides odoratimimus]|uniref:TonB-dependent receptor domain-containing protein n=1 Tax=Myroides odoratimimus TaxID=76832 RepID=UPI002578C903|nr:TonB-dependent receptor [Myroides odoratimimus]MDM1094230.1 TonB-dependent receptor [Myroides odoratimimus]
MKPFITILVLGVTTVSVAQDNKGLQDSIPTVLDEISMLVQAKKRIETEMKMAVSVDEFLASSEQISFIKRGAYAWEPMLNNMSTERSTLTIDGMHIFGACTDKMDPVTSYVESNNLSTIDIKSGQEGGMHGATVAGSIDLKRKTTAFGIGQVWTGAYQSGFEFNNKQFFNLGNISFSSEKLAGDASIAYREASNYKDGNNDEVKHSQYKKFNTALGLAYKTGGLSSLRADVIFDVAKDVGFPALPMDLWLSRALITSVSYKQLFEDKFIRVWDTKAYFNAIEHYMDDTTRPENLVHMDMPGWSTTYGLLSKANFKSGKYSSELQLNAYNNHSIAEMRMYPQDRSKQTMFAYSWPWVTTTYAGVSLNNTIEFSDDHRLNFGGSAGINYNYSKYIEFNWIFHPGSPQEKTRFLPSLHTSYEMDINRFNFSVGVGYGHRAPSVSEAYGYYIYNSYDRYDYIGNPNLKNEISNELNASVGYKGDKFSLQAKVNYFYIKNYVIGRILSLGSPMNYQSVGVKGYTSLDYATLFNFALNADYHIMDDLHWKGGVTYARGQDNEKGNLPFIRPFSYQTSLHYLFRDFSIQTSINGDAKQRDFSPEYGESLTPSYTIWNASVDYTFYIKNFKTVFQVGAENLLNEYYSTYADWGNIPRMGRNVFTSLKINF